MASLQASYLFCSSLASSKTKATLQAPKPHTTHLALPKLLVDEYSRQPVLQTLTTKTTTLIYKKPKNESTARKEEEISKVLQELYAIMDIVADRAEMHKNIGVQRDNWNRLILNSVNGMTMTAATMAGVAAVSGVGAPFLALKISSSLLYMAVTGILLVTNKIQPSQLAEEQRNASRLFKQLHEEIKTTIAIRNPSPNDVKDTMEKVLALDKAYPLPLLGTMLAKFPTIVEPAVWWPEVKSQQEKVSEKVERNGWSKELEGEMKGIVSVLKREDTKEYVRLSKVVLRVNKILAICGPLFTVVAAVCSAFMGSSLCGSWATVFSLMFGALAIVVNTLEHGWQVGMVFEMYRDSAGFFRHMVETIESTLKEEEVDKREDGELFEVKVALQLGRSLSELRDLASDAQVSSTHREVKGEFASKLF